LNGTRRQSPIAAAHRANLACDDLDPALRSLTTKWPESTTSWGHRRWVGFRSSFTLAGVNRIGVMGKQRRSTVAEE
jgi:hypothetical protein